MYYEGTTNKPKERDMKEKVIASTKDNALRVTQETLTDGSYAYNVWIDARRLACVSLRGALNVFDVLGTQTLEFV
jgi:hypothetical protein